MKFITLLGLLITFSTFAQTNDSTKHYRYKDFTVTNLETDTQTLRERASSTLVELHNNGAVIVRLKTSTKSIAAYRKAGQNDVAERIEKDLRKQNERIYDAFTSHFYFCKVYFIYSNDTKAFLEGNKSVFLNSDLEKDPSITPTFTDDNFIFCEYGSPEAFSGFQTTEHYRGVGGELRSNRVLDTLPTRTTTSPATTSGLFFLDKTGRQLLRPFPFVEGVYFENYDMPVSMLSKQLERSYRRLVEIPEQKNAIKAEKKRLKAERKKLPRYNPFK